jgi:hypothetical membrane protein
MSHPTPRTTGPIGRPAGRPAELPAPRHRPVPRSWARAALGGLGVFAAASLLGGALNPGYSLRSDAISSLAAHDAHAAAVMTVGFAGLAVCLLAAGGGLLRGLRGRAAVAGSALVVLAGVLSLVVGSARLDCSALTSASCAAREHAGTVSGGHVVHNLVSLVLFVALVAGSFLLSRGLRRDPAGRHLARATRYVAWTALLLMVWFGSGAHGDDGGLVQRAFLLVAVGWPVLLVTALSRPGTGSPDPVG